MHTDVNQGLDVINNEYLIMAYIFLVIFLTNIPWFTHTACTCVDPTPPSISKAFKSEITALGQEL